MSEIRPKWPYKLSLEEFNNANNMFITKIEAKTKMMGVDTLEYWLELSGSGDIIEVYSPDFWELFKFTRDRWNKLIELTHEGERAEELAAEIKVFDDKHNSELALYKRLKKKFEDIS